MLLTTTEIDLNSFFDVKLVVFTTIAFLFSVLIISLLVFGLAPINRKAKEAQGLEPERINVIYLRLIIYILAEFIAFVSDIFLVIFGRGYTLPWSITIVFLTITFYKLVFVLFKDFKDLGFNAKGIISSIKTASKLVVRKDLDAINRALEEQDESKYDIRKDKIDEIDVVDESSLRDNAAEIDWENNNKDMNKRVKYKNKTLRSKFSVFFTFLLAIPYLTVVLNFLSHKEKNYTEIVWCTDFNNSSTIENIAIEDYFNKNKFVASELSKLEPSEKDGFFWISKDGKDTIIIKSNECTTW